MTQFVEQLRNQAKWYAQPGHNARDLMDSHLLEKAADEIEQLAAKLEAAEKERDELRAKIEQMEKQGPVAELHRWLQGRPVLRIIGDSALPPKTQLYALPGAQPTSSAPDGWQLVPEEVISLYNYMCAVFVPMTPQQEEIAIQLGAAKRAMLAAAPEARP